MSSRVEMALMASLLACTCMSASSGAIILAHSHMPAVRTRTDTRENIAERIDLPDGAVARLHVEGTPIEQPVAHLREGDPDGFFLTHDVSRASSPIGAAYLSRWDGIRDTCVRIFGHHLGDTDLMFSPISDAYRDETFDAIGPACVEDETGTVTFKPLCALHVDETYSPIRKRDYTDDDLTDLIATLVKDADVRSKEVARLSKRADRLLVLVTCSAKSAGGPKRTLVVFAHTRDSGKS